MASREDFSRRVMRERVLELCRTRLTDDIEDSCIELPDAFARAHQRHRTRPPTYVIPNFEKLTSSLGGIPERGFTILTGPTGAGKTTLVGNLWVALSLLQKNIYTVPIEVGPDDFMDMLLSVVAKKTRRKLRAEDYEEARTKWLPTWFANRGHVLALHESRLDHIDFLAEVLYHHEHRDVSVAFADNWNFMLDPLNASEIGFSDQALHDCIVFSKKIACHIWMIMHPKKDTKAKTERIESMYDIKGSVTSVQESTNVLLFNRLKDPEDAPPSIMGCPPEFCREISIAKARYNGRAEGTKVIYSLDRDSELYQEYKLV